MKINGLKKMNIKVHFLLVKLKQREMLFDVIFENLPFDLHF